ncbi:aminotransferase class V-fold PLP-dependent enzyme [uncultured Eubacterium sp.]|uniref:aminotransferase class V-fold PLP-dependent enzyme n=1 Tax=uncultured Eubacterium sp. TaxID=165185 RepID=UPI0015AE3728|nr:aminotransferase class V-fold PLP-dependent enzyme [uncultured Eubacterium sp.]
MIYFDNAATSYPKPRNVISSVMPSVAKYSFNSGRGGYKQSLACAEMIYDVREKVADFFGFSPENIVFTKNCTEALNMAIKGSVKKGEHIIISSLEHNSVSRVVNKLQLDGVCTYDVADFSFDDEITLNNFSSLIKPNTSLVVCTHSSNAFGVSLPIAKIGSLCRKNGIRFIVDGAQGAGVADINAKRDNIDILCAPGHKCLYGLMGTGFMAIADGIKLDTLIQGGTGSSSLLLTQPEFSPDRYEAGTLNNVGIISLGRGIDFIRSVGREKIYEAELSLCEYMYDAFSNMDNVTLYTPAPRKNKTMPILSFNVNSMPSERTASVLGARGICVRSGYHCSPLAHKHFDTLQGGTVRISVGAFNVKKECITLVDVVKKL